MTAGPLTGCRRDPRLEGRSFFSPVIPPRRIFPLAIPREHPYIWATWLARPLAGEAHCEWAGWFRAHYRDWTKPASDFDQAR